MTHIMRRTGVAVAALWLITGGMEQAKAGLVEYSFSGTIFTESGPAPVTIGDRFTGSMVYDDSAPNLYVGPDADTVRLYDPLPLSINVSIANSILYSISDPFGTIQLVNNNTTLAPPFIQNVLSADVFTTNPFINDRIQILIASQTISPVVPSGPISSILLQGLVIDLSQASSFRDIVVSHSDSSSPSNNYIFRGRFDSFTALPEPSTIVMASIGVLMTMGCAWFRRKPATA